MQAFPLLLREVNRHIFELQALEPQINILFVKLMGKILKMEQKKKKKFSRGTPLGKQAVLDPSTRMVSVETRVIDQLQRGMRKLKMYSLDFGGGYTTLYIFLPIHRTVYLKRVSFTVCKLYLNKSDLNF